MVHMALLDEASGEIAVVSLAVRRHDFRRSAPGIRRQSGWSGRSTTCSASRRTAHWMSARGSITASGVSENRSPRNRVPRPQPSPTSSCRSKARACIRFRSGRCTPGSSSLATSASPRTARPWCAWRSASATSTKASRRSWPAPTVARAAQLAGRTSGDSTVAYALAFARAVEAAAGTEAPPRAVWLRALMAELERIANHLGDIGAICNDAAFALMHAHCGVLRELVLRAAGECFGHRLMMDRIVPGGVAADLSRGGRGPARAADPRPPTLSRADRALRQHRLAPGPHGRHGPGRGRAGPPVRRRRPCRPRRGRAFDARRDPRLSALRPAGVRSPCPDRGRRQRPRVAAHSRGRAEPRTGRADPGAACRRAICGSSCRGRAGRRHGAGGGVSRRRAGLAAARCATGESSAATCAIRPGSSGRCSRRRSRTTSSPTSRCATSRSTARTRATTSSHAQDAAAQVCFGPP